MQITILENNIKDSLTIYKGISTAVLLCKTIGLEIVPTYKTINKALTSKPLKSDVVETGYMVDEQPILDSVDGSEDIACMIYDWSLVNPRPTNPVTTTIKKGNAVPMQIPEEWYGGFDNVLTEFFLHELCHALYFLTGTPNDQTHFKYSYPEYVQKSNEDYYLFLIKSLVPAWNIYKSKIQSMETYLNFNPKSDPNMIGVSPIVMNIAQKVRTTTGLPMKLTSGLRSVQKNTEVGGEPNSAHLRGLALDFAVTNQTRQVFLNALITCGTSVFIEDCPDHLHFDIDSSIHNLGDMIVSQKG